MIILGVSSGIAAFKAIDLAKQLCTLDDVQVVMSSSAKKMLAAKEFEKVTKRKVVSELFPKEFDYKHILKKRKVEHIELADHATLIIVAPATANTIAKLAWGIADDVLSTTILASTCPILICPSMNVNMWNNDITKKNISSLLKRGYHIADPDSGDLACGYTGKGRLPSIACISSQAKTLLQNATQLKGKKIIVTAGGTQEPIDHVRVISNRSSGKMGIAIAEECTKRGANVTLIRARTEIDPFAKLKDIPLHTSKEMLSAIKKENADVIIHSAAVSDFLVQQTKGKISSSQELQLELTPNTKILERIKKKNTFLVGFKAEYKLSTKELIARARDTMKKSSADLMIANDIYKHDFGSDRNEITIVDSDTAITYGDATKREHATLIVDQIAQRL